MKKKKTQTCWILGIENKYHHLGDVIKSVYLKSLKFPFQAKVFRLNKDVIVLPNGVCVSKNFFHYA